jgi:TIR domain
VAAGKIFVCYRREDSAGHAGRLYDRLSQRFRGRVFMDVASIGVGTRWAEVIEETLRSCEVAIILIGKRWLEPGPGGVRRIDQREDPTRAEIATALRLNLKIVPLLVSGAAVPERSDLPADVAAIAEWQALRVDDDDFDHDATRLIRALEHQLGDHEAQPPLDTASPRPEVRPLVADAESAIDEPRLRLRRRGYFGFGLGPLRLWVSIGVAAVAIVVVQVGGLLPGSSSPSSPRESRNPGAVGIGAGSSEGSSTTPAEIPPAGEGSSPVRAGSGTGDSGKAPKAPRPAAIPGSGQETSSAGSGSSPLEPTSALGSSVAGEYALVSYSERGNVLPVTGAMRLTEMQPGSYQFETFVKNPLLPGVSLQYRGVFQGSGDTWTVTTMQTNDPNVLVATPIVTYVRFDGSTLATENVYGQAAVWRKR